MSRPNYILTVTLNPAIDKTLKVRNFKPGDDYREEYMSLSAGGKGINVARVLNTFKLNSLATGIVGGISGEYIKTQLGKEKIRYDFSMSKAETRTNLTIIDTQNPKITRILERGPALTKNDVDRFKKKFSSLLASSQWVVFSGSIPQGVPNSIYSQLIALADKKKIKTVLDTSGIPLAEGIMAKPFLVKPNLEEVEYMLERKINSFSQVKSAAEILLKKGVATVIISLGERGAVVLTKGEAYLATPPKVAIKNYVGCGDTLLASFLSSQHHNINLKESIHVAVATATASALTLDPGAVSGDVIKKMVNKVKLKKI